MKYLLIPLLLVIVSCTNNSDVKDDDVKASETLVGVWRGSAEYQNDSGQNWNESWKVVRDQSGNFNAKFLVMLAEKKQYGLIYISGKWLYKNGAYIEIEDNSNKTIYNVFSLKKDSFKYKFIDSDEKESIKEIKTEESYQLQEPPDGYTEFEQRGSLPAS